ncbi:putative cucumisin [Helianthus anomalus]
MSLFSIKWSPSTIKSALMTTSLELKASQYSEAEFAHGSGHIDPLKAIDLGLVYENFVQEYFKIWCNISQSPGSMIHKNASCPMKLAVKEINYPSMAVQVVAGEPFVVPFPKA